MSVEPADLVARLATAAQAAILNERPSLEHPDGSIRGITIELTLTGSGQLDEAVCFVERRSKGPALLARSAGAGPMTGRASEQMIPGASR